MPEGIGYPLPPPPGLLTGQPVGLPRPVLPVAEQPLPAPALSPDVPTTPLPAPVMLEQQAEIPPPPIAIEQGMPAPWWIQQVQGGGDAQATGATTPAQAGAPMTPAPEPDQASDEFVLPDGVAPDSPVGLTMRGLWTQQQAQKAKVRQLEQAGVAIKEADARTAKRLEEQQARQVAARERVATQNAEIQQALRAGPGGTWRDVMATGASALGAVLGAAFDRSGTLQRALPQTLNAIVDEGQKRMQSAFGRQIQALQVGREAAGDELDAALDEDRKIEQAGAATRLAILEEAQRQITLAAESGQLDLMELRRIGVPQQMEAAMEAERAKQAQIAEEQARKDMEFQAKQAQNAADLAYKQEQTLSERADRAKQWADLDIARQRLALDKDRSAALKQQDALDVQKKKLDVLKEQGLIDDRQLAKAVPLPGGEVLIANDAERARAFAPMIASSEVLYGLLNRIAVKMEAGDERYWASPEAQRLVSDYNNAVLATKDAEVLGAIQGADMGLITGNIGPNPTDVSLANLRSHAPLIRQTMDTLEVKVNARARAASSDFAANKMKITMPRIEEAQAAVPTAADAQAQLVPMQSAESGKRPRIPASEYSAAVTTMREAVAAEVGAIDKDAVLREQASALGTSLQQAREERERLVREREEATRRRKVLSKLGGPKADEWAAKEAAAAAEIKTIEGYEKRLTDALKRERKLLYERTGSGNPRIKASEADRAAYRRVVNLIGDFGGKPTGKE